MKLQLLGRAALATAALAICAGCTAGSPRTHGSPSNASTPTSSQSPTPAAQPSTDDNDPDATGTPDTTDVVSGTASTAGGGPRSLVVLSFAPQDDCAQCSPETEAMTADDGSYSTALEPGDYVVTCVSLGEDCAVLTPTASDRARLTLDSDFTVDVQVTPRASADNGGTGTHSGSTGSDGTISDGSDTPAPDDSPSSGQSDLPLTHQDWNDICAGGSLCDPDTGLPPFQPGGGIGF